MKIKKIAFVIFIICGISLDSPNYIVPLIGAVLSILVIILNSYIERRSE